MNKKLHPHPKDTTRIKIIYNYECCSNSYSESPEREKKKTGTFLNKISSLLKIPTNATNQ